MPKYLMSRSALDRRNAIRTPLLIGLLLILTAVMQLSFFGILRPMGVVPDLTLAVLLALAYFCGGEIGAIAGIVGGVLLDAMGGSKIWLLPLFYLLLCYTVGKITRTVTPKCFLLFLPVAGVGVLLRMLLSAGQGILGGSGFSLLHFLLHTALPELLLNLICVCAFYYPVRLFCRFLQRKRKSQQL